VDEREAMDPAGSVGNGGSAGAGPEGPGPDLAADLRTLGENLRDALRAAWESRERERLQAEIEGGLKALGHALGQTFDEAARDLRSRERARERVAEVRRKMAGARAEWRSGHAGDRVRGESHEMLHHLNESLQRSKARWTPPSGRPGDRQGTPE